MTWAEAKTALAIALDGLTAELPEGDDGDTVDRTVQRVFKAPPASIEPGDLPCIVFLGSTLADKWEPSMALETYELTCWLLLRDEDAARSIEWTEAFREVVKTVLRLHIALGYASTLVDGATFTPAQPHNYAGVIFTGFEFTLPIVIEENVDFAIGDSAA